MTANESRLAECRVGVCCVLLKGCPEIQALVRLVETGIAGIVQDAQALHWYRNDSAGLCRVLTGLADVCYSSFASTQMAKAGACAVSHPSDSLSS